MWHHNVDLLAYHDLDGRSGFKLALQEADGRFVLYVAGFWHSGWSILEVTDPEHPELLRWLDGPPNTMTIQVQVADGTMITALEHPPSGLTIGDPAAAPQDGFLIWDVREPDRPQLLGQWVSGAADTHRNFYNGGPWVYATSSLPGFEGQILAIVDIADPASPKTAGTWWHPGQHKAAGEAYTPEDQRKLTAGRPYPQHGLSLHGGAYAVGDRAYCPWMRGGMVILDIADKHHPRHLSTLPVYPPLGSTIAVHSAVPLPGRDVVVINDEALRQECDEPASYAATVDISDESDPIMTALFPQPRPPRGYDAPSFCQKGGWFGPHNQHQQQGLDCGNSPNRAAAVPASADAPGGPDGPAPSPGAGSRRGERQSPSSMIVPRCAARASAWSGHCRPAPGLSALSPRLTPIGRYLLTLVSPRLESHGPRLRPAGGKTREGSNVVHVLRELPFLGQPRCRLRPAHPARHLAVMVAARRRRGRGRRRPREGAQRDRAHQSRRLT